jgi:hypothetical protein
MGWCFDLERLKDHLIAMLYGVCVFLFIGNVGLEAGATLFVFPMFDALYMVMMIMIMIMI